MDFEPGIERLEALIFHINRFLQQIALRLETLYLVAGHLNLQLRFEDGSTHERLFQVPDPTRDSTILLRMLHTYLESFRSDSAVTGLAIRVEPARASERQLSLFESDLKDPNRFAETLARLEALLGENHVGSPEVISRHKPDGVRMKPFVIEHSSKEDSKSPHLLKQDPPFALSTSCSSERHYQRIPDRQEPFRMPLSPRLSNIGAVPTISRPLVLIRQLVG